MQRGASFLSLWLDNVAFMRLLACANIMLCTSSGRILDQHQVLRMHVCSRQTNTRTSLTAPRILFRSAPSRCFSGDVTGRGFLHKTAAIGQPFGALATTRCAHLTFLRMLDQEPEGRSVLHARRRCTGYQLGTNDMRRSC